MKRLLIVFFFITMLSTTACTQKTSATEDQLEELKSEISSLSQKQQEYKEDLSAKDERIKQLEKKINSEIEKNLRINQGHYIELLINKHLLEHMPNLTRKVAILKEVDATQLTVDFAEWRRGEESSMYGLFNDEENEEVINLHKDVRLLVLSSEEGSPPLKSENLHAIQLGNTLRAFDLYMVDGEVILIKEKMLP